MELVLLTREEIMRMLDIDSERMKYLARSKKINEVMESLGYRIVDNYKEGRITMYKLESIESNEWKQHQLNNRIKKKDEHTGYAISRLMGENMKMPRKVFIENWDIDISQATAKKYDDMLVEIGALKEIEDKNIFFLNGKEIENVVYRYLDKDDNILYIGKTNNMKIRTYQHLIDEKESNWNENFTKIQYVKFNTYGDCGIAEQYYIMKLKPKYNETYNKQTTTLCLESLDKLEWLDYEHSTGYTVRERYVKGENYNKVREMLNIKEI